MPYIFLPYSLVFSTCFFFYMLLGRFPRLAGAGSEKCGRRMRPLTLGRKDAARRWLLQQEVSHKPLIPTTKEKRRAFLATCASCQNCNSQYCFSLADEKVVVEKTGESVGPPNLKKIKLTNAKKYGASSSPFCCFEANVEGQSPGRPKTYSGPAEESKAKLQVTEVFGRASGLSWRPQAVRRLSSTWGGGAHRTHGPYQGLCALACRVCCD